METEFEKAVARIPWADLIALKKPELEHLKPLLKVIATGSLESEWTDSLGIAKYDRN
ncbi:MAG: hypothetical protein ACYDHZ_00980 [Dehalococcoidia bacterium]